MRSWPTARTRVVALLGWPVDHSRSPAMHNAAFAELGLDLVYVALPTPPDRVAAVVDVLGAVGAVGANVTVPHKLAVRASCTSVTDEAALVGAVNTLHWTGDGLVGDNTDAVGLADAMVADGATEPGARWSVLGTGGAARAVAVAAGRLGCPLTVVGRRREAAADLADLAVRAGAPEAATVDVADEPGVRDAVAGARTVVNATPLGMGGEQLPAPFHALGPGQAAYDLVYRASDAGPTPFVADAAGHGAGAHDGVGMLVAQAGASLRRWTGQDPPLTTMRAAADAG